MASPSSRDARVLGLLRTHLATIPSITDAQIQEACDLWHQLGDQTSSLRSADKNLAAALEYLWHSRQQMPLRTQKQVAAAHNVSAPTISQQSQKLRGLLASSSVKNRAPAPPRTQDARGLHYDLSSPETLPPSLPELHLHLEELFALGLWTHARSPEARFFLKAMDMDLSVLCFIPEDAEDLSIHLLPIAHEQEAMLLLDSVLPGDLSFLHDLPLNQVTLHPITSFHKDCILALTEANLMPIGKRFYPHATFEISTSSAQTNYLVCEAFVGALLTFLKLARHTDARTHLFIHWDHPTLGTFLVSQLAPAPTRLTQDRGDERPTRLIQDRDERSEDDHVNFYTLEIALKHSTPRIWRRVRVRADLTFLDLHHAIQDCMEWYDGHLWEFRPPKSFHAFAVRPGHTNFDPFSSDSEGVSADLLPLSAYFGSGQTSCTYVYDFGDDWEHTITLKKTERLSTQHTPIRELLAGKQHAPFEDCGGMPGFERLMKLAKTGKDPWGADKSERRELIQHYELNDLGDFDLAEIQEYFDEMTQEHYLSSEKPTTALFSGPEDMMTVPTSPHDTDLKAFIGLIRDQHRDAHDTLREVFDLLVDYGVSCDWPIFFHKFALVAWSMCLERGNFKKKSPAIHAGAVLYAMSLELLDGKGPSQADIAKSLGTSQVSISKMYPPILEIMQKHITDKARML